MKSEVKSTRFHERVKLRVPLQVYYRENADKNWVESTLTEEVTICGVGFTLSHPIEPKHPVRLVSPIPKNFRLFDYGKEKYDVWGIIRYLRLIESGIPNQIRIMIGTALIGGKPPASFLSEAQPLYDLKPFLRSQSFWDSRELPRMTGRYVRSMEDRRKIAVKVILQTISEQGQILESGEAETFNISESGAAVICRSATAFPRFVLLKTEDKTQCLLAAVREAHRLDTPDFWRLHLEFISGKWIF